MMLLEIQRHRLAVLQTRSSTLDAATIRKLVCDITGQDTTIQSSEDSSLKTSWHSMAAGVIFSLRSAAIQSITLTLPDCAKKRSLDRRNVPSGLLFPHRYK